MKKIAKDRIIHVVENEKGKMTSYLCNDGKRPIIVYSEAKKDAYIDAYFRGSIWTTSIEDYEDDINYLKGLGNKCKLIKFIEKTMKEVVTND